jgi:hypothetical protein
MGPPATALHRGPRVAHAHGPRHSARPADAADDQAAARALAKDAFEQATQTNQTSLDDSVGEETRWLVVFPRISLSGSQILRNCFAGVSSLPHEGQAWLEGPLSHGLERAAASWLNAQPPFLLMTLRGRIYLRLQLASADEQDIAAAVTLFGIAAGSARRVARARGDEPVSWSASTTSAWQSLPPANDHR